MVIRINFDECIGCGVCSELSPSVFLLDEDKGRAKVISQNADCDAAMKETVDSCPVSAIFCETKQ